MHQTNGYEGLFREILEGSRNAEAIRKAADAYRQYQKNDIFYELVSELIDRAIKSNAARVVKLLAPSNGIYKIHSHEGSLELSEETSLPSIISNWAQSDLRALEKKFNIELYITNRVLSELSAPLLSEIKAKILEFVTVTIEEGADYSLALQNSIGSSQRSEEIDEFIEENLPPEFITAINNSYDSSSGRAGAAMLYAQKLFYAVIFKIIDAHKKTLSRKQKTLVVTDDYGIQDDSKWLAELHYFKDRVLIPSIKNELETNASFQALAPLTATLFDAYFADDDDESFIVELISDHILDSGEGAVEFDLSEVTSGHEYESFVANILRGMGFDARVTKGSGDHGADILFNFDNQLSFVAQCKFYNGSPVGNGAVQEAYSAKAFYDADAALVITNSTFTPAAKMAAQKLNVLLIHHDEIPDFVQGMIDHYSQQEDD